MTGTADNLSLARVAYEVSRKHKELLTEDIEGEDWNDLKYENKDSILKAVNLILNDSKIQVSSVHDAWIDRQIENGWTYGRKYDEGKKTSPKMVSYRGLPPIVRATDKIFYEVVRIGIV